MDRHPQSRAKVAVAMETSVPCRHCAGKKFVPRLRRTKECKGRRNAKSTLPQSSYDRHYRDTAGESSRSRAPAQRQYNVNVGTFPHTRDSSLNFATARQQVATHIVPISPPIRRQCRAGNVAATLHRWSVTTHSRFPSPKLSTLPNVFLLSMGPQGRSPDNGSRSRMSRSHRLSAHVATTHGRRNYVPGDAARRSWG